MKKAIMSIPILLFYLNVDKYELMSYGINEQYNTEHHEIMNKDIKSI